MSGAPQAVTAEEYERATASAPVPVLVDFWAPWCGPCRAAAPVLESLGRAKAGSVVVLKVNTDEHPAPSQRLGIQGIPTFVVFKEGRELGRQVGMLPAAAFTQWVDRVATT